MWCGSVRSSGQSPVHTDPLLFAASLLNSGNLYEDSSFVCVLLVVLSVWSVRGCGVRDSLSFVSASREMVE